ncbi:MAG: serine/threonine protein kinase [Ramlibacter sp.]|jgi:serine/threonine protein kinase|nr:serine/threonine protein kinase [Ramlibacter sp.]
MHSATLAIGSLQPTAAAAQREPTPHVPGFRLLRPLGRGRRSTVWLAQHLRQRGELALKLQQGACAFERESILAARAAGPYLLQVHGHGRAGAWKWLAMEYLPGGDLAARLSVGVDAQEALELIEQAARGVAQLHRKGLVHRDVKPANFLVRESGTLVLADLGLAAEAGRAGASLDDGRVLGTPRYVAPEQLQGAPAAPAADVYSLGVLLHEMLSGRPLFNGETVLELLSQQLVAQPPRLPAPAAALQPLVDKMLCKEVNRRLPDAEAVLGLLGQRWTT